MEPNFKDEYNVAFHNIETNKKRDKFEETREWVHKQEWYQEWLKKQNEKY